MIAGFWIVVTGLASVSLGFVFGSHLKERSLLTGPDEWGATGAHCIRGEFYYLVPERTFNGLIADHYHLKNLGDTAHEEFDEEES